MANGVCSRQMVVQIYLFDQLMKFPQPKNVLRLILQVGFSRLLAGKNLFSYKCSAWLESQNELCRSWLVSYLDDGCPKKLVKG